MQVSVGKEKGKRMYLTEVIDDDFWDWKGKKILIAAPTGMGKTTFVVRVLLKYMKKRRKKLLILCN
ncbi:MAG: DEAD/DEAH box helicase family protein [Lachnospiraceae bacterium]|nr:DEAD/DEAH box helicase family protein [Lachnospiraceae bacterium]